MSAECGTCGFDIVYPPGTWPVGECLNCKQADRIKELEEQLEAEQRERRADAESWALELAAWLDATQRILMWATPAPEKDYDADTAFTEIRRIAREQLGDSNPASEPQPKRLLGRKIVSNQDSEREGA